MSSIQATVDTQEFPLGLEFTPDNFKLAVTPNVSFPTNIAGTINVDEVVAGSISSPSILSFDTTVNPQDGFVLIYDSASGKYVPGNAPSTGTPGTGVNRLNQLTDVDSSNLDDLSILQYDQTRAKWVVRTENDFIDGRIDGGFADTVFVDMFDIDGGFA